MAHRPDFPFYAGKPVPLAGHRWLILMASLALALVLLSVSPQMAFPASLIPPLLFLGIPLLTLRVLAGRHWTAMFGRVGLPQVGQMVLFGILPFLATLWFCVNKRGLSRRTGVICGVTVSALIFGPAHLPTYDWNWAQALIGIGSARVVLTLAYVITRNLWVFTGAHILNDWSGFLATFAFAHVPIGTEPV